MAVGILKDFEKRADERIDIDFNYTDFLTDKTDTIASVTVTCEAGITVDETEQLGMYVKAWITGGTAGQTYKVTCQVTTTEGRIEDAIVKVKVKA